VGQSEQSLSIIMGGLVIDAKSNEWISLDLVLTASPGNLVLVLVVGRETETILQNTRIHVSQDGKNWACFLSCLVQPHTESSFLISQDLWNTALLCIEFFLDDTGNSELQESRLSTCKTAVLPVSARFIRLSLLKDMQYPWTISEIHVEHRNGKTNSNRGKGGVSTNPRKTLKI